MKSTPLKKLKTSHFSAKERLVLGLIDYMAIVDQSFESSSFWQKNAHLLLVFYLHEQNKEFWDYIIHIVDEWSFSPEDIEIIRKDWEFIQSKVIAGRAHELTEGDTFYLGACPKGQNSNSLRVQPNSSEKAMQRAFSFKASYVNHIIASIVDAADERYGKKLPRPVSSVVKDKKMIPLLQAGKIESIEDAIVAKYAKYYGKTIAEIQKSLQIELNKGSKQFYSLLSTQIQRYEEIDKAGIIVKTVVLPEGDKPPKENMSFPAFQYEDFVTEEWETSKFKELLECKFLFVFFQRDGDAVLLRKVKIWNMPYSDICEAKKVWDRTKQVILNGNIVKDISINGRRKTNFPGMSFNRVAHVRPHAITINDTYPLPVRDKLTKADRYSKHAFWLNNNYILSIYNSK